jgi:hypothetical protein
MRTPAAAELLDAWEGALSQPPVARALALLALACPEASAEELARLSVGRRDGCLLQLRQRLFGYELCIVTSCPACGTQLQSSLGVDAIVSQDEKETCSAYDCGVDGYRVSFRLPNSRDIMALNVQPDQAPRVLLDRCVIEARDPAGDCVGGGGLPEPVIVTIAARMAELDPLADVRLRLTCPDCRHGWEALFDIASFLWREIHGWAQRTLRDVHALAATYGWREEDVLRLSPTRRQIYLELARR